MSGKNNGLAECCMCHRFEPRKTLVVWSVRNQNKSVCRRCHPFFKIRFAENRKHAKKAIEQLDGWLDENHI